MKKTNPAPDMSIPAIIRELTPYMGRFPKQAVRAAIAKREEVVPHLLQALQDVADDPAEYAMDRDYMLHHFAVFLLAQFREKRAYRPLVEIVSAPGEIPHHSFGDTITEELKNLLASVYDGDPEPLRQLIENDQVDGYVRGAAIETFLVLVRTGQMSREEAADYYGSLFCERLEREPNHAWNDLACAVADLPAPELLQELRKAYEEGLVDPGFSGFDELE